MGKYVGKIIAINTRNLIVTVLILFMASHTYAAQDPSLILSEIEKKMAGVTTIQASFVQEKRLAAFNQPVSLKGKIFIQKPNLFSWQSHDPVRYSMLIKGDTLKQWDEESNQIQQVSLSRNPNFSLAVAQMRIWFFGAYLALLKDYDVDIVSNDPVILEFRPRPDNPARGLLRKVRVSFAKDKLYLKAIDVEESNGDSSTITFFDVVLNKPITPSTWDLKAHAR